MIDLDEVSKYGLVWLKDVQNAAKTFINDDFSVLRFEYNSGRLYLLVCAVANHIYTTSSSCDSHQYVSSSLELLFDAEWFFDKRSIVDDMIVVRLNHERVSLI